MYYAIDRKAKDKVVHAFECIRVRMKWVNQRPRAVALASDDWIVLEALREGRVESHASQTSKPK